MQRSYFISVETLVDRSKTLRKSSPYRRQSCESHRVLQIIASLHIIHQLALLPCRSPLLRCVAFTEVNVLPCKNHWLMHCLAEALHLAETLVVVANPLISHATL